MTSESCPASVWEVLLLDDVVEWFTAVGTRDAELVAAAIDLLEEHGPSDDRSWIT